MFILSLYVYTFNIILCFNSQYSICLVACLCNSAVHTQVVNNMYMILYNYVGPMLDSYLLTLLEAAN